MGLTLSEVRRLLKEKGLTPRKRLGQNFLVDPNYQRILIEEAGLKKDDVLLEIGPGLGNLTVDFVESAGVVIAVEKDNLLSGLLRERLGHLKNFYLVNTDILSFDLQQFIADNKISVDKLKVFGNLPYYITSDIMEWLVFNRSLVSEGCFTVQKEVAQRFTASAGSKTYGRLSVFLQFYAQLTSMRTVVRTAFYPRPKVDSAFLKLRFYEDLPVKVRDERLFFELVKAAFSVRRKNILNALLNYGFCNFTKEQINEVLNTCSIPPSIRAESLTVRNFAVLSDAFSAAKDSFLS